MGAPGSPLLDCRGHALFRFHEHRLVPGLVCGISLAPDRTSLLPSQGCQSYPAPAEQVVHLRWMCGSAHLRRNISAIADLPIAWAKWLVLSAPQRTGLTRPLLRLPDLHRHWHPALPAL